VPHLPKNMTLILDAHDIVSDRIESFKTFGRKSNNITDLTRQEEYDYFKRYDYVVVIKKADCDKVSGIIGKERVILAGHPASEEKQPIRDSAANIGFVASSYSPNLDAINWFLNEVWPHVSCPQITLSIFGSVTGGISDRIPANVRKIGMVADIDQIYRELDIVINPVRFGAGLKIKNIEALARGLPLVTTPHGAEGIEEVAGRAFLVAADPQGFRRHIDTLVKDNNLRRKLSDEAYHYAREFLSEDCCFTALLSKINGE
jgi:glycosyltransferase involved in cell wall biosynthesis